MTETESEQSGTGIDSEQDKLIAACRDCGFVAAVAVEDFDDEARATGEDPAFRHYKATGHSCGSFVPTEDSPLEEQWEAAYGLVDASDLMDGEEVFELASGVEA